MDESYVQVAVDGVGKKVRNQSLTEPQAVDTLGNAQADLVRYQQVVSLANTDGSTVDDPSVLLRSVLQAQNRTNELLELVLGALS